jgi:hypothetical protein
MLLITTFLPLTTTMSIASAEPEGGKTKEKPSLSFNNLQIFKNRLKGDFLIKFE